MFSLGLGACVFVGPDYKPPEPDLPGHWSTGGDHGAQNGAVLAAWWREFDDPVLDSLVEEALAANLDLASARAQIREARAQRRLAWAELGPSANVNLTRTRTKTHIFDEEEPAGAAGAGSGSGSGSGSVNMSGGAAEVDTTEDLYNAKLDASWEIDLFGGKRRGLEAAKAGFDSSVENLRDVRVSLVAEVVLNYIDLRTAQQRLAIAESSLASLGETYDLASWRMQAGLVSELDVAQARTELESTRANLPSFRTSMTEARNRLAVLLGRAPGELATRLEAAAPVPLANRALAVGIPADTLRQRPDVRVAERNLAAQTARLGEAMAERYPSFTLSGSFVVEALTLSALNDAKTGVSTLMGSVTAPIFDSGRIRANIRTQDAVLEQNRLAYQGAVLTALEDVENALVGLVNTRERRSTLEAAAGSARETLGLAEHRYSGGLVDFLTVLDGQRTLLNLEDQLAGSTGDLATAQVQLFKALGGGWSPDEE